MPFNLPVFLLVVIGLSSSKGGAPSDDSKEESYASCPGIVPNSRFSVTPGLLSVTLPYKGHLDCIEGGSCAYQPLACPSSSCCQLNGNTLTNSTLTDKRCGCLNGKGACVPIQSVRIGMTHCSNGLQIASDFEVSKFATGYIPCSGSTASITIAVNDSGHVFLNITASNCQPKLRDIFDTGLVNTFDNITHSLTSILPHTIFSNRLKRFCGIVLQGMEANLIVDSLEDTQLQQLKLLTSATANTDFPQQAVHNINAPNVCFPDASTFFSVRPGFQTTYLANIQHPFNSTLCGASGECRSNGSIINNCPSGKMCCVAGKLQCEYITGIQSCLEYKQLQRDFEVCTADGVSVSSSTSVRVLPDGWNCEEVDAQIDMDVDGKERFKLQLRLQKCIPMARGRYYILVVHAISAVQNIEAFLPSLKAYMKSLDGPGLLEVLGEKRVREILANFQLNFP